MRDTGREFNFPKKVLERFKVLKVLGRGNHGVVYKVTRFADNKAYALKETDMSAMKDREREDALNEIRILGSLRHLNVVRFYEAFISDNKLYMVMEYAPEGTLRDFMKWNSRSFMLLANKGHLPEPVIWQLLLQILQGLKSLHDSGIVHRDMKPENIFRGTKKVIKIGDLGVAKALKEGYLCQSRIGTPYYMAPEVWQGRPYHQSSDMWSVGCVLYELMTLRVPFDATSASELKRLVTVGRYQPIKEKSYSDLLIRLCNSLLCLNPMDRPTCTDILCLPAVLDRILDLPRELRLHPFYNYRQALLRTIMYSEDADEVQRSMPSPSYDEEVYVPLPSLTGPNLALGHPGSRVSSDGMIVTDNYWAPNMQGRSRSVSEKGSPVGLQGSAGVSRQLLPRTSLSGSYPSFVIHRDPGTPYAKGGARPHSTGGYYAHHHPRGQACLAAGEQLHPPQHVNPQPQVARVQPRGRSYSTPDPPRTSAIADKRQPVVFLGPRSSHQGGPPAPATHAPQNVGLRHPSPQRAMQAPALHTQFAQRHYSLQEAIQPQGSTKIQVHERKVRTSLSGVLQWISNPRTALAPASKGPKPLVHSSDMGDLGVIISDQTGPKKGRHQSYRARGQDLVKAHRGFESPLWSPQSRQDKVPRWTIGGRRFTFSGGLWLGSGGTDVETTEETMKNRGRQGGFIINRRASASPLRAHPLPSRRPASAGAMT